MADPGIASDLKSAKMGAAALAGQFDANALNQISQRASRLGVIGSGITLGGLSLDGNLNPSLG
jgi:hypothetical protein